MRLLNKTSHYYQKKMKLYWKQSIKSIFNKKSLLKINSYK